MLLRDNNVIPSINFDSDHRPLTADFKYIEIIKKFARTTSQIKIFKVQNKEIREEFQNKIKQKNTKE